MLQKMLLALVMCLLAWGSCFAQESVEISASNTKSATLQAVELAHVLVNYGIQQQDAYVLLAAANILSRVEVKQAGSDRVTVQEQSARDDSTITRSGIGSSFFDKSALIKQAETYARNQPSLKAAISALQEQKPVRSRGVARSGGYVKVHENIPANGQRNFKWKFIGNEPAEIMFMGDPATDIDVYVYEAESGKLLASDESAKNGAYFSWKPPETKEYMFRVVNKGKYDNNTYIVSN